MRKLNQVLAVEKGVKQDAYTHVTDLHNRGLKAELLNGFERTYRTVVDGGRGLPSEDKKVQNTTSKIIEGVVEKLKELFDVTATKDWANCKAKADVVIDGRTLLEAAPPTYLLFLVKQLSDLLAFVVKFPELDPAVNWSVDPATGLFKGPSVDSVKTEKVQEALTLAAATDKHPAQAQMITKDVVAGIWTTTHFSGAMARPQKDAILARIKKLQKAVQVALEEANSIEVEMQRPGEGLLAYVFGG